MTKEFGRDSVKLHATVMNANFVDHNIESRETGPRGAKKYKINATSVLKVNISRLDPQLACTHSMNIIQRVLIVRFNNCILG